MNTDTKYVTPRQAASALGVSTQSLRRWEADGRIQAFRTPGGQRRFLLKDIENAAGIIPPVVTVCYARVSTHSQRDDLERQLEFLRGAHPEAEFIREIGSGLNFRRKRFLALLERVMLHDVNRIVVAHPDRLCRFGFELVKWLCEFHEVELVVLDNRKLSPEQELVADMLSIIHCFSSRLYGLRKYTRVLGQELRQESVQEKSEPATEQRYQDSGASL